MDLCLIQWVALRQNELTRRAGKVDKSGNVIRGRVQRLVRAATLQAHVQ